MALTFDRAQSWENPSKILEDLGLFLGTGPSFVNSEAHEW